MASRTFTKEFLMEELDLPYNAIKDTIEETSRWSEHHYIVFEFEGKFYGTSYSCGATEMQYESPWEYEKEVECQELKLAVVKREEYVPVEYKEEATTSNGSKLLQSPPTGSAAAELWAFYNAAEKEAKEAKDKAAKQALVEVSSTENKFIRTSLGGAQMITKVNRKAKDTLKFFLQQHQLLEVCKKDDIDLKKVDELVEAGMLPEEEISKHISETKSSYLQLKK